MGKSRKMTKADKRAAFYRFCSEEYHRTRHEELANGISHMIGVAFGIVALTMMVIFSSLYGCARHVVSCSIYGATLIILTLSSAMYHLMVNWRAKRIFQICDHASIYLLIAGTNMPFALVTLGSSPRGWVVFGIEWGLAFLGILLETVWPKLARYLSLPIYIAMGWLIVLGMDLLCANMALAGIVLLFTGGVVYTLGVIFYAMDHTPYMHTVWHAFVLGGIVCHWVSIMFFVIPQGK